MIVKTLISQINVGDRRREDLGDIAGLAKSIEKYGQFHPVIIDGAHRLVAGERRLRACELLGRQWIEARQVGDLSDSELREFELEENLRRKDLSELEIAKEMVRKAAVVAPFISTKLVEKDSRGRKPKYEVPKADVAEAIGTSTTELVRAEQHVETADAFPVFQKPDWKQYHVLEARTHLNELPSEERAEAVAIIDQPAIPPRDALKMLRNITTRKEPERHELYSLHKSPDMRDKSKVITTLAEVPPMPDPRLTILRRADEELKRCASLIPDDPLAPRIAAIREDVRSIINEIREESA